MADFTVKVDLKPELLRLLEDAEILAKLKQCVSCSSEEEDYRGKYEAASKQVKELENKIKELTQKKEEQVQVARTEVKNEWEGKIQQVNEQWKNKLKTEKGQNEKEIGKLKEDLDERNKQIERVKEFSELAEWIARLKEPHRRYISELAGGDELIMYLCLARHKNKLQHLWNYIKDRVVENEASTEEIEVFSAYFDKLISLNNRLQPDDKFTLQEVTLGKEYDSSLYIKTLASRINGRVEAMLIKGYRNGKGDFYFKPVVYVK